MHLQNSNGGLASKHRSLHETLERLRSVLEIGCDDMAAMMELASEEYEQIRIGKKELSVVAMAALTESLDLSLESVIRGTIDFKALAARRSGNLAYVPERYSIAAHGRRRNVINLLNYIEDFLGWETRRQILRHFNVSEAAFTDPQDLINPQFFADVCWYLKRYRGFKVDDFYAMGAYSVVTNCSSPIAEALGGMVTSRDVYLKTFNELVPVYFERNHEYRVLKLSECECRIECLEDLDIASALEIEHLGSLEACATRLGTIASLPGYAGLPFADAKETSCVHRGDSACVLELELRDAVSTYSRTSANGMGRVHQLRPAIG